MLAVAIYDQLGYAAGRAGQFAGIQIFGLESEEHRVEDAQQISVRYENDSFGIIRQKLFTERLQTEPYVPAAFRVGEKPVVDGLFVTFEVFEKPLYGFTAAFSEVAFAKLRFNDRSGSEMGGNLISRLSGPFQVGSIQNSFLTGQFLP